MLAAVLRLINLGTNPGWDGDEGYNYNIALNLARGHHQMFALDFVFVQHPPLFFLLAAGLFRLFGPSMFLLRLLATLCSLGTLLLLLPLAREVGDTGSRQPAGGPGGAPCIALLAMLAYAVTPLVVLQTRFGYTYNALALWTVLTVVAVLRYRRTGTTGALVMIGVAATLALTTDQEGVYLLPVLLFGLRGASLVRRLAACALALAGPALYIGVMALTDRAALLFDITHTAGRVTGGSLLFQGEALLYYLADLLRFDPVILCGLAGLALVPRRPARRLILGLLAAMLLVILKVRDPNPLFRTAEPLLPLVCLGLGLLGSALWARLAAGSARRSRWGRLVAASLLAVAVITAVSYGARAAMTRFPTAIDGLLPRSTGEAAAMTGWLNHRLHPTDLVIAMPQVSWAFHARTAELLQAVAYQGKASAFYPAGIARSRWRYAVTLGAARFLVVDDFTHQWIAQNAAERALVARAEHRWRRVYAHGEYTIYENPTHAH